MNKLPVLFIPGTLCTPAVFEHEFKAFKSLASNVIDRYLYKASPDNEELIIEMRAS